jgi:hypothetical protein
MHVDRFGDDDARQATDHLTERVSRWGRTMPGMDEAVRALAESPWIRDHRFVEQCLVAVDHPGDPVVIVDWAAVSDFLAELSADHPDAGALRHAADLARRAWNDLALRFEPDH